MQEERSSGQFIRRIFRPGSFTFVRSWGFWIGLALILTLVLHLWSLTRYPAVSDDEAWLVSRAWAFIQTGHQFGPLDDPGIVFPDGIWTLNQWLITFLQAGVLRLFPAPNLIALRVLSLVFGIGLLGANYWTALRLGGKWLAVVSTLLLSLSRAFFHSAHLVRYDILAALFSYLSLAIVVNNRRGRFLVSLAAGVILGLGIETHLNSLIFIPVIGVYFMVEYGRKILKQRSCWGFAAGLGIGILYYLTLHILPYPATFFQMNSLVFGQTLVPPLLTLNAGRILQGFVDTGGLILAAAGPLVILMIVAAILIFKRHSKGEIQLLAINLTLITSAALVFPLKNGHYSIMLAPAASWLAGIALKAILERHAPRKLIDLTSKAVAIGLTIGAITLSIMPLQNDGFSAYKSAQSVVNSAVEPGDRLIGPQAYWLGLYDHKYYSWELLFLYPRQVTGTTLADAFSFYKPDLFVIDPELDKLITDNVDPSSQWYYNHLSRIELEAYLKDHAQLVSTTWNGAGSNISVYRLKWK